MQHNDSKHSTARCKRTLYKHNVVHFSCRLSISNSTEKLDKMLSLSLCTRKQLIQSASSLWLGKSIRPVKKSFTSNPQRCCFGRPVGDWASFVV